METNWKNVKPKIAGKEIRKKEYDVKMYFLKMGLLTSSCKLVLGLKMPAQEV